MGVTNPAGKERFIAAAFPSACGKTNLAMLKPSLPGWKVRVVGQCRFPFLTRLYSTNRLSGDLCFPSFVSIPSFFYNFLLIPSFFVFIMPQIPTNTKTPNIACFVTFFAQN